MGNFRCIFLLNEFGLTFKAFYTLNKICSKLLALWTSTFSSDKQHKLGSGNVEQRNKRDKGDKCGSNQLKMVS